MLYSCRGAVGGVGGLGMWEEKNMGPTVPLKEGRDGGHPMCINARYSNGRLFLSDPLNQSHTSASNK